MIRLKEDKENSRRWTVLLALSFFLHASIIGALVFVPDQTIRRFTSSMDFSVVKDEKKEEPLQEKEEIKDEEKPETKPPPVKKKVMPKPAKEEKAEEPPPPEVKKFEMSETSFDGDGTWALSVDIGDNRIGSVTGTAKETVKTTGPSTGDGPPQEKPRPKNPKKIVIKEKPKVVNEVTIPYPDEARRLEIEGDVKLEVYISEKGTVTKVKVLKDPGCGLGEAAAKALKKFKFSPAMTEDGKTVPYKIKYIYSFVLD